MKYIRRYNESNLIKATDDTIREIVHGEINKLGNDADLNHIDVSGVTTMSHLFFYNLNFNGHISGWNVGNVQNMEGMFRDSLFNRDISGWNVRNVTNMHSMFWRSKFNGDISGWNVRNVTNMNSMFFGSQFNGDISGWNVGNVTDMSWMFSHSYFNGDLSRWNVGNVTNMNHMFANSPFSGDISGWNVSNVELNSIKNMFIYSPLKGNKRPWWSIFSPLFGSTYLMYDSLDFGWIDIEGKVIYRDKLIKTLKRSYNREWNGELPGVFGFTYK